MQKIQILFPDPTMERLRQISEIEDRPVSEIVRRAVDRFLQQFSPPPKARRVFPTFRGGGVLVSAEKMKQEIYSDDAL